MIILGAANLIADGFSMAVSNYLGFRAERQQRDQAGHEEQHQIEVYPEGEREEVRQILAAKGLQGEVLDAAVDAITSDREQWVEMMLTDELGFQPWPGSPIRAAVVTFFAFIALGSLPLVVFAIDAVSGLEIGLPFLWSAVLTGVAFFAVGTLKARFVEQSWLRAGFETLAIGGMAALLAYLVGILLQNV